MTTQKHTRTLTELGMRLNQIKHRIAFLREQESKTTDPNERARLRKEIEENENKESATLAEMRRLQADRTFMRIRESGKTHQPGYINCAACDQTGVDGTPFIEGQHFPHPHVRSPPCTGLIHAEIFESAGGWEIVYQCDTCGAIE